MRDLSRFGSLIASAVLALLAPTSRCHAQTYGGGLAPVPGTAIDDELRPLLDAWRRTDLSGLACAHCHAPDAIDLAMFSIADSDILRRASFHVGAKDAQSILALVQRMRALHVAAPRDRFTARPLQPGGEVLPGATHYERDAAFGEHLRVKWPTLTGDRLHTVAQALAAKSEILTYDVRNEPIGIALPRWSEDGFHGGAHGTLNDWLPDISPVPANESDAAVLFGLHDAYIADPTPANLWAIQAHNDVFGVPSTFAGSPLPGTNAGIFGRRKHSSMLAGQHLLRMEHAGVPIAVPNGGTVVMRPNANRFNFPFNVASRINQADQRPAMVEFPSPIILGLNGGRGDNETNFRAMLQREMLVPWWMVGFILEPGMHSIPNWHEYFPQSLVGHRDWRQPVMMHHAFVTTTMLMHRTYTPVPNGNTTLTLPSLLSFWTTGANPQYTSTQAVLWASPEHEALYRRTAANAMRMQLLLAMHEADTGCAEGRPYRSFGNTTDLDLKIETWIAGSATTDPAAATADGAIAWGAFDALGRWKRGCAVTPVIGDGTGLSVMTTASGSSAATTHHPLRLEITAPASGTTHSVWAGGMFAPPTNGAMRFDVDHGPNATTTRTMMWVNGQLAFSEQPGVPAVRNWITLSAGVPVVVRIEYERTRGVGTATRVRWESTAEFTRTIPSVQLWPLSATPRYVQGDLNLDGVIDGSDLAQVLVLWGNPQPPLPDLSGDGVFGGDDLAIVLANWGL